MHQLSILADRVVARSPLKKTKTQSVDAKGFKKEGLKHFICADCNASTIRGPIDENKKFSEDCNPFEDMPVEMELNWEAFAGSSKPELSIEQLQRLIRDETVCRNCGSSMFIVHDATWCVQQSRFCPDWWRYYGYLIQTKES